MTDRRISDLELHALEERGDNNTRISDLELHVISERETGNARLSNIEMHTLDKRETINATRLGVVQLHVLFRNIDLSNLNWEHRRVI